MFLIYCKAHAKAALQSLHPCFVEWLCLFLSFATFDSIAFQTDLEFTNMFKQVLRMKNWNFDAMDLFNLSVTQPCKLYWTNMLGHAPWRMIVIQMCLTAIGLMESELLQKYWLGDLTVIFEIHLLKRERENTTGEPRLNYKADYFNNNAPVILEIALRALEEIVEHFRNLSTLYSHHLCTHLSRYTPRLLCKFDEVTTAKVERLVCDSSTSNADWILHLSGRLYLSLLYLRFNPCFPHLCFHNPGRFDP